MTFVDFFLKASEFENAFKANTFAALKYFSVKQR
jgi:hypothetical protein